MPAAKTLVSPVARIVRTVVQIVVTFVAVLPLVLELLNQIGWHVNGTKITAVFAALLTLVVAVQNKLEDAGLIAVLGGKKVRTPPATLTTTADGVFITDGDDDEVDGCDLDFTVDPDDDETAALRPLFPDGDPSKEAEWRELFG